MPDFHHFFMHLVTLQKAKVSGSQISSLCPVKDHTKKNLCFSANIDTGQCKCHKGCFSGNAYTLAQRLNIDNPEQWLSKNDYKPMKLKLKTIKEETSLNNAEIELKEVAKKLHGRLVKQISNGQTNNLPIKTLKEELVGYSKNKQFVFPYFNDDKSEVIGIKYHKPKPYSTEGFKCTWYMGWYLKDYDTDNPLYICEGEKDAIVLKESGFQVVSSSNGAGSLPDELDEIIKFECIFVYDNDEAGEKGALKNAMKIKKISKDTIIKIAKWNPDLKKGYDVGDDLIKTNKNASYNFDELDNAINNAVEFKLTLPGKIGDFTIMTGSHMEDTTPPPVEWLIENVLPKHFNSIIAGTTGSKKSYWALQLALSLANGEREFCGNKIVNSSGIKVLYIDTECDKDEIHRRFKRIINHMDNWSSNENITVMAKGGRHVDIWKDVHEIVQITNPELIIFDSLYNSTSVNDFSKSPQMSRVTNELSEFKVRYGVTVLGIGHFNKGNHEVGLMLDRMSGASALQNWIEFAMLMTMTNRENFNIWRVAKTRGVPFIPTMYGLEWNDFWFTTRGIVDDINPFLITTESKLKWNNVLEDCPRRFDTSQWLNVYNQKFKMSERTGREWLRKCLSSRMIKKVAHGIYEKNLGIIDEHNIDT